MCDGARRFARDLRLTLAREHLGRMGDGDDSDLVDPISFFDAFARSADALDGWHAGGGRGERPPGQLRRHTDIPIGPRTKRWAQPLYHRVYDPEGRPRRLRRSHSF